MKKYGLLAVAVLTLLGMLSPLGMVSRPAFAQEMPKVTISGFIDSATAWERNVRDDALPTTDEEFWHSRHRARFNITGQTGKAKAVLGFEMDFTNGRAVGQQGGTPGSTPGNFGECGFDLGIDEAPIDEANHGKGCFEVTTMYAEFPATGPGSLIPQIPVATTARWGGQTFSGHEYKTGLVAQDRFGGVNLVTALAPNVKNTLTFVQIEEEWTGTGAAFGALNESWAILESVEFTPQKGLTIKPTFVYEFQDNSTSSVGRGGILTLASANLDRYTIGAEARWREGPYMVEPTFFYQGGTQDTGGTTEADISAWIIDVLGTWRQGPLTVGGRVAYSPGNDVADLAGDAGTSNDVDFFRPLFNAGTYWNGWSAIWVGSVEYQHRVAVPCDPASTVSCGEQGLLALGAKANYALTPALTLNGWLNARWSAEDLDTNADGVGDENFLGTEIAFGFDWRFAPNLSFHTAYAHLFAGDAGNIGAADAEDSDYLAARVRVSF